LVIRQALLQQEVNYMLEIGASGLYGYIDEAMVEASRQRLEAYGFNPELLDYEVASTSGAGGDNAFMPLPRGVGLRLKVAYPYERLLDIDRLIGIAPPSEDARISGRGMRMSEYVP